MLDVSDDDVLHRHRVLGVAGGNGEGGGGGGGGEGAGAESAMSMREGWRMSERYESDALV